MKSKLVFLTSMLAIALSANSASANPASNQRPDTLRYGAEVLNSLKVFCSPGTEARSIFVDGAVTLTCDNVIALAQIFKDEDKLVLEMRAETLLNEEAAKASRKAMTDLCDFEHSKPMESADKNIVECKTFRGSLSVSYIKAEKGYVARFYAKESY